MRIFEARRNPELNPKIDLFNELNKYAKQKDVFVTFTSGFQTKDSRSGMRSKIGINPNNAYSTPVGIYCYPIDYILDYNASRRSISAPYTGRDEWKFLYILRVKEDGIIETDDDAKEPYEKMVQKAKDIFGDEEGSLLIRVSDNTAKLPGTKAALWNLARLMANSIKSEKTKSTSMWTKLMREVGVKMLVDRNKEGLIHQSEPTQGVIFDTRLFSVIDTLPAKKESHVALDTVRKVETLILQNKFNLDTLNPKWIESMRINADLLNALAGAKTVQFKAFAESLQHISDQYYIPNLRHGILKALNRFIPLKLNDSRVFETLLEEKTPVSDWEETLGRKIPKNEWRLTIENIMQDRQSMALANSLRVSRRDYIPKFIEMFATLDLDNQGGVLQLGEYIHQIMQANGIKLNNEQLKQFFTKCPTVITEYRDYKPSVTQWVKAGRMVGIEGVVDIIPLDALKMLMETKRNKLNLNPVAYERLIKAKEDAFLRAHILQATANGISVKPVMDWSEVNSEWMVKNLDGLFQKEPNGLFNMLGLWRPSQAALKKFWSIVDDQYNGHEKLLDLVKMGAVLEYDLREHATDDGKYPAVRRLVSDIFFHEYQKENKFQKYDYFINYFGQKFVVDMAVMFNHIGTLKYNDVRYMFREYPETIYTWAPGEYSIFSDEEYGELLVEFPDLAENPKAGQFLSPRLLSKLIESGKIQFSALRPDIQAALVVLNSANLVAMMNDPRYQPFPTIKSLLDHRIPKFTLNKLKDRPLPASVAFDLLAFTDIRPLTILDDQLNKFLSMMVLDKGFVHMLVFHDDVITNYIDDNTRAHFQIAYLKTILERPNGAEAVGMLAPQVVNPAPATTLWLKQFTMDD